jgi:hypothetical protein
MPGNDDKTIIVMPFLRSWYNPRLQTVGEAVDLFGQLFEVRNCNGDLVSASILSVPLGLAIYAQTPCRAPVCNNSQDSISDLNCCHRDISDLNVMMDGAMYPNSWHPCNNDLDRFDPSLPAKHHTRSECPPKYYFIDFGLSRRYDPKDGPPLEPIIRGGDKSVPEFQNSNAPCNPFPTDIYYMGNFIRQQVLQVGY